MTQTQGWFGLWKNQFPWNWFSYFWCFKRCLVMHSVLVWGNELKLVISSKAFYLYFSFFSFLYLLNYWWSHFIKSTVVATNSSVRFPLSTTAQQLSLFVLHQVSFSMYIFKTWWSDNIHSHYNISIINGKNVTIYPSEYLRNIRLSTHFPICFSIWYLTVIRILFNPVKWTGYICSDFWEILHKVMFSDSYIWNRVIGQIRAKTSMFSWIHSSMSWIWRIW